MFSNTSLTSNSCFAKLHASVKFLAFVIFVIVIFLPGGFFNQLILLAVMLPMLFIAKISIKSLLNILKVFILMFVLFTLINIITSKEPLAFYLSSNNFFLFGGPFNNWLCIDHNYGNDVVISQFYGGYFAGQITSQMVSDFSSIPSNLKDVNRWFNSFDKQFQNELLGLVTDYDGDQAKTFLYMLNNDFTLNNVAYKSAIISGNPYMYKNIAYNIGANYLYVNHWYSVSPFTFARSLNVSIKVILVIMASTILTQTTTAIDLTNGLEKLLSPLKIFKFPASECALIISIGIRFIPSLLLESKRILNAQASRGLDFHNGNLIAKIKSLVALIVPMFSISIRKSDELANAMDARGFVPNQYRTTYRQSHIKYYDYLYLLIFVFLAALILSFAILNFRFAPFGVFELGIS